ncbi:unnamed protein product [Cylicocyclus nassatus]|uniref:Uncharacterized protein n=1 Tax=Cylicocyclus nassatus TaxID=53992 RepID=A0AA36GHX3_CYLNA|nr:unnamed protein product [Cylicocyclus nassatus]
MSEGEMAMDNVPPGLPGKECDRMGGKYKYPENQEFRAAVVNATIYGCNLEFWSRLYLNSPRVYKAMEPAKIWVAGRAGYQYEIPDAEIAIGSIFECRVYQWIETRSLITEAVEINCQQFVSLNKNRMFSRAERDMV